jgi:hypothetical protein
VTAEVSKNGHLTAAKTPELILAGEVNTLWFDIQINFWSLEFMGTVAVDLNITDGQTGASVLARKYQGHFNEKSSGGLECDVGTGDECRVGVDDRGDEHGYELAGSATATRKARRNLVPTGECILVIRAETGRPRENSLL